MHFHRTVLATANLDNIDYLLELVLDYGEHDLLNPQPNDTNDWECRNDAFSDYRAGFDIRTYRQCKRILMFHYFKELNKGYFTDSNVHPCLVRSIDFQYVHGSAFTLLKSIAQTGNIRKTVTTYSQRSLPLVEFTYEHLG